FYQRKEIKDILAYLRTIANGVDDLSVLRIINVPKRGIGATTMGKVTIFASEHGMSLYDALKAARQVPGLGKAAAKIEAFVGQIESFKVRANSEDFTIQDLIEGILDETGYRQELEAEGEIESQTRLENIEELVNKAVSYEQDSEHPSLDEFLEQVALVADIDNMDESENRATLMTLHSAKGLEFPKVYLVGMEDGLFPSMMSITADDKSEIEEERRLCYVGITRAREELVMTSARQRMVNGETRYSKPSQFVEELPASAVEFDRLEPALSGYGGFGGGGGSAGASGRKTDAYADDSLPWNPGGMKAQPKAEGRGFGSSHNPYASRNTAPAGSAPASKPAFGKAFTVQKQSSLDYGPGDRVSHIKFGQGTVKSVEDGAKDYEVTVEFDKAGQKKMFASFAKLKKI
ncbi:ATP-dependent helicase, partial [Enterocloster lavalensis]